MLASLILNWELLNADDLVIVAEIINELLAKLSNWKSNMGKTKGLYSRYDAPKPVEKSRFPCGVCLEILSSAVTVSTGYIRSSLTSQVVLLKIRPSNVSTASAFFQ